MVRISATFWFQNFSYFTQKTISGFCSGLGRLRRTMRWRHLSTNAWDQGDPQQTELQAGVCENGNRNGQIDNVRGEEWSGEEGKEEKALIGW